jgi:hypothetical protein
MKRILVVGLAVVLAAAGNAFAGGGQSGNSSSTTNGNTSSTGSSSGSSSSAGQQSGGHSGTASHSSGTGGAPVAHHSANVQYGVHGNINPYGRVLPSLDRAELLARQAAFYNQTAYYNRIRMNPVQRTDQRTVNPGQVSASGGQVEMPNQAAIRTRRPRGDENNVLNKPNGMNRTPDGTQMADGTQGNNRRPMPATNTPPHKGRPVLNFNNSNTMSFADACRRHRNSHDCNWWRNHCTTIILIGGGFYAWDLGYWYPAYGYDNYYSNYAYDGPIYGYDGLPPDQIIANVQYALQQLGYFSEAVDGVLGGPTRSAIEDYQVENDLPVTGAIDRPLLVSLGFIR